MVIEQKGAERRRHERYELKDRVFITFRPSLTESAGSRISARRAWLLNIRLFRIIPRCPEKVNVDIFSAPRKFDLSNLPCQLVYDTRVDRGKDFSETVETDAADCFSESCHNTKLSSSMSS